MPTPTSHKSTIQHPFQILAVLLAYLPLLSLYMEKRDRYGFFIFALMVTNSLQHYAIQNYSTPTNEVGHIPACKNGLQHNPLIYPNYRTKNQKKRHKDANSIYPNIKVRVS